MYVYVYVCRPVYVCMYVGMCMYECMCRLHIVWSNRLVVG